MQIYKFINFCVHLMLTSYNIHLSQKKKKKVTTQHAFLRIIYMISYGILTEKLINSSELINSLKEVSKVLSTRRSSRLIWVKSKEVNKSQTALLLALSWFLSILTQGQNHSTGQQGEGGENPFMVCKNIEHFEDLAYKNWSWPSKYLSKCNGTLKKISFASYMLRGVTNWTM